jgi:hypothetical protein
VGLDGFDTDEEFLGNLTIPVASTQQSEDF